VRVSFFSHLTIEKSLSTAAILGNVVANPPQNWRRPLNHPLTTSHASLKNVFSSCWSNGKVVPKLLCNKKNLFFGSAPWHIILHSYDLLSSAGLLIMHIQYCFVYISGSRAADHIDNISTSCSCSWETIKSY
jgi:hypothetical protein